MRRTLVFLSITDIGFLMGNKEDETIEIVKIGRNLLDNFIKN